MLMLMLMPTCPRWTLWGHKHKHKKNARFWYSSVMAVLTSAWASFMPMLMLASLVRTGLKKPNEHAPSMIIFIDKIVVWKIKLCYTIQTQFIKKFWKTAVCITYHLKLIQNHFISKKYKVIATITFLYTIPQYHTYLNVPHYAHLTHLELSVMTLSFS